MVYLDEVQRRLRSAVDPKAPTEDLLVQVASFVTHEVGKSFWNGVRYAQQKARRNAGQR